MFRNRPRRGLCEQTKMPAIARGWLLANTLPLARIYSCKVIIVLGGATSPCVTVTSMTKGSWRRKYSEVVPTGWIDFRTIFFFYARRVSNRASWHHARHPLFTRAVCAAYRIVGCGRSFAFISRKTMPAPREELIGMFENITATSRCYKVARYVQSSNKYCTPLPPLLIHPDEYCINLMKKKRGKRG